MDYEVEYIKNCMYNKDGVTIDCVVKFVTANEEFPFTANPNDVELHGRTIYKDIVNGVYGQIAPYAPPLGDTIPVVDVTPQ